MSGGCGRSDYGHRSRCPPSGLAVDETVPSGKCSQYLIRQSTLGYFPGQIYLTGKRAHSYNPRLFSRPKVALLSSAVSRGLFLDRIAPACDQCRDSRDPPCRLEEAQKVALLICPRRTGHDRECHRKGQDESRRV